MELYRCPNCNHWRCRECEDNSRLWLRCCQCGEVAKAAQWYHGEAKGRPHDLEHSPRLGTGKPPGASKAVVENLIQSLKRYSIPLNAFKRYARISPWAIRQAGASKRALSPRQELLINLTMQRIQAGKLWLRRKSRQRWELEWIDPPYKPYCAMKLSHCHGGLLPRSCPREWKECVFSGQDWEGIEKTHQAYADKMVAAFQRKGKKVESQSRAGPLGRFQGLRYTVSFIARLTTDADTITA